MRIAFFGSGAFGLPTLERLAQRHELACIITQPDRPAGRGGALTPTPVGAWAAQHAPGVPLLKPERVNDPGVVQRVHALAGPGDDGKSPRADAWVIIAFGQFLGRALMAPARTPAAPAILAINLHASLLPRWRGAAPINAAILAGDALSGNSVIGIAPKMDAGLIYGQSSREIPPRSTAGELHDALAHDGPDLVERVLSQHARGELRPVEQDEALVTIAPKLSRADAVVDFTRPAEECRRRINALSPWPGVTATLHNTQLKLLRATTDLVGLPPDLLFALDQPPARDAAPGTLLDAAHGLVRCGQRSTLRLLDVQPANRTPMPFQAFANGRDLPDALHATTPAAFALTNPSTT